MLTSREEVEEDINATLEQLMQNSEALKMARCADALSHEVAQLEKIEESLLARLMHRQSLLEMETRAKKIEPLKKEAVQKKGRELQKFARSRKARSRS